MDGVADAGWAEVPLEVLAAAVERSPDRVAAADPLDEIACRARDGSDVALRLVLKAVLDLRLAESPVRSVLLDPADVDDAVQSTLIVVAEKIASFEGRSRFSTWVDRVARNEALMVVRRKSRKSEPATDQLPELDASARRLSSLVADHQTIEALMERLSDEHREVLRLREGAGLGYDEIADRLGVPVGTVRSRINRARRLLSDLIVEAGSPRW